ncbi:hypothetical protein ACVNPZ_03235 [Staphylococcus aureus]
MAQASRISGVNPAQIYLYY